MPARDRQTDRRTDKQFYNNFCDKLRLLHLLRLLQLPVGCLKVRSWAPYYFWLFINDLESGLLSSLLKFADTKVFCQVNGERDREQLQADLNRLTEWSEKWQMPFNTSKCWVMHLGRANKFEYTMGNDTLEVTNEEKDLGVITSSNLKPNWESTRLGSANIAPV